MLSLAATPVSDLGPLIALVSLQKLTANGCHLSDLPRTLVWKDTLTELTLHQTTIPSIPAEVLSPDYVTSCLAELRHHLTDLEAGTEDVRQAKLMVLGNGRVGKTQICRRLRGLPYDDTIPSTHGISEPVFARLPGASYPPRPPQVFVSYAWGDDTPAGQQRARLVDDLCAKLGEQGVHVRRDCDELRPGELLSEFMDRLAAGDCILAVISDKYLRSEYCMYELFRIYRHCADKPEQFLGKVVPLILPDASLHSLEKRLQRAIYWTQQKEELQPLVAAHTDAVGTEFFRKFKLIGEFARNTSNMLEYLVDKLQPRDFTGQAREGVREILRQIGARR